LAVPWLRLWIHNRPGQTPAAATRQRAGLGAAEGGLAAEGIFVLLLLAAGARPGCRGRLVGRSGVAGTLAELAGMIRCPVDVLRASLELLTRFEYVRRVEVPAGR